MTLVPGSQFIGNGHEAWDPALMQWRTDGAQNVFSEGEVVPFRVSVEVTEGQEWTFVVALDLDASSNGSFGFTDTRDWDTDYTPTVTPPLPGDLSNLDDGFRATDVSSLDATFLGTYDTNTSVSLSDGSIITLGNGYQYWEVNFTPDDGDATPNEEIPVYVVYGGLLAASGAPIRGAGGDSGRDGTVPHTVPDGFGASNVNGVFQARVETVGGGDKTVNFNGGQIISPPPPANPSILLEKTGVFQDEDGDGFGDVNETIAYEFKLTNDGDVTLSNVTVDDPMVTIDVGSFDGTLDPGEMVTLTGSYAITQADIDAGVKDNTALATGEDPDGTEVEDPDDHSEPIGQDPDIELDKFGTFNDEDGDGFADVGETISYAFTVENDGNVTLTNVTLADQVGGVTISGGPIPTLAPGAIDTTTFTGTYTIDQGDIDAGSFLNEALITGTDPDGDPVTDPGDATTPLPQNPDIDLVKDVELTIDVDLSGDESAGDELTYTFTIKNTGNVTLTDVEVTDPLPGLSNIVYDGDSTLAPGEILTGTATYIVTPEDVAEGDIENTATVTAEAPDGEDVTDTDTEIVDLPEPALEIDKTSELLTDADGSLDISAGDTIRYTVEVSNIGEANLTGVTVEDSLAGGFLTLSDVAGDGVDFLGAGDSETAIFDYVVQDSDLGTTIVNTAIADSVQTDPVEDTENVDVPESELTIDKMFTDFVDNDGNGEVTQGDILNYDIKGTNNPLAFGGANLTNVVISDSLTGDSQNFGTLEPGEMATLSVSYTVTEQDAITGLVSNIGVADSDQTPPVEDPEDVPVKLAVDIDIKPGSFPSSFNLKGKGTVPVAIFGTANFDATEINEVCLEEFLPGFLTGVACTDDINFEDVNGDGFTDAVAKFSKPDLIGVLNTDSTFAKLTGMTDDGIMFVGIGDVNVTQV